jgi:carboxyl-terminal processing protease
LPPLAKLAVLLLGICVVLAGCGGGSSGKSAPAPCTVGLQKGAVADLMREWYLFNDEPEQQQKYASLDLSQFATPDDVLTALLYRPDRFDRNFSFLTTLAEDQQFFGEGRFIGFGFGSKFADAPVNTDLRLTQVFAGSPAAAAGLERGQRILAIDGRTITEIAQAEGVTAALGPIEAGVRRTFSMRRSNGTEFDVGIVKDLVTIDPVPSASTMTAGAATVGYLDFRTFVSTADDKLDQAFANFVAAGATALVVDLRYNGGGLVVTARRLADLIAGFVAKGEVQSRTIFNSSKSSLDTTTLFQERLDSLSLLQQVVFITTGSSASASELVINALKPHTVVRLVGTTTFGKPVGQNALSYCGGDRLLRAVSFETVNSLGEGQYFDGLPVDCPAADELERRVGDPLEASLATALGLIDSGSCPSVAGSPKPAAGFAELLDVPLGPAATYAQRYAGTF